MAQQTEAPFFVVNQHGVSYQPYLTKEHAIKDAQKLAKANPGKTFYVTQATKAFISPQPEVVEINYD